MIIVNNLVKKYNNKLILDINNIELSNGVIYGIIGDNGSGKSTLMKCLTNLVDYSGDICFDDKSIKKYPEILKGVGLIIETPMFYNDFTAIQNLEYFLPENRDSNMILKRLGLDNVSTNKVKTYSLGMKQKLAIALACLKGTKLIILDEPFNGLDVNSVKVVVDLLLEEKQKGKTIIVSSHMPKTINKLCDVVYKIENKTLTNIKNNHSSKKYLLTFDSILNLENARKFLLDTYNLPIYSMGFDLVVDCHDINEFKTILKQMVDYNMISYEEMSQELEAMF